MHGLSVSPALGTRFSGNGDFFGLAYNGDYETDVLGYGQQTPAAGDSPAPGPIIVGAGALQRQRRRWQQRIAVEDFSFPSAYVDGGQDGLRRASRRGHRARQRGRAARSACCATSTPRTRTRRDGA